MLGNMSDKTSENMSATWSIPVSLETNFRYTTILPDFPETSFVYTTILWKAMIRKHKRQCTKTTRTCYSTEPPYREIQHCRKAEHQQDPGAFLQLSVCLETNTLVFTISHIKLMHVPIHIYIYIYTYIYI